jgi:DNA-binding PadR family transcriptional regulator
LPDELSGLGRFAAPSLSILLALGDGPQHGYAIMAAVRRLTGEPLGPGTLYATLSRLEERGLIESLPSEDRRRPYRLTGAGVAVLRTQLEGIEGIVKEGLARLGRAEDSGTTA